MKTTLKAIIVIIISFSLASILPISFAQNYTITYQLLDTQEENPAYTLNIAIPQTLLQYYQGKNHQINTILDFAMFVTPYALKPIADCLRQIYPNDEDFANGALQLVHQINYVITNNGQYPVETFVNNQGDCDIFSSVAASIIKAGGLNVVLLEYEAENHMNIGIHLADPPENARGEVYKITYNHLDYYIGETTGGNWTKGWRVGETSDTMKQATTRVIPLDNIETIAPGQVSASFSKLEASNVAIQVWPPFALEASTVTLKGSLSPTKTNENVTIYLGIGGLPWTILKTVQTSSDGTFEYVWKTNTSGIFAIRASWIGDNTFAGSTSGTASTMVIPLFLGALIAVAIIAIIIGVAAVIVSRFNRHNNIVQVEPQPLEAS